MRQLTDMTSLFPGSHSYRAFAARLGRARRQCACGSTEKAADQIYTEILKKLKLKTAPLSTRSGFAPGLRMASARRPPALQSREHLRQEHHEGQQRPEQRISQSAVHLVDRALISDFVFALDVFPVRLQHWVDGLHALDCFIQRCPAPVRELGALGALHNRRGSTLPQTIQAMLQINPVLSHEVNDGLAISEEAGEEPSDATGCATRRSSIFPPVRLFLTRLPRLRCSARADVEPLAQCGAFGGRRGRALQARQMSRLQPPRAQPRNAGTVSPKPEARCGPGLPPCQGRRMQRKPLVTKTAETPAKQGVNNVAPPRLVYCKRELPRQIHELVWQAQAVCVGKRPQYITVVRERFLCPEVGRDAPHLLTKTPHRHNVAASCRPDLPQQRIELPPCIEEKTSDAHRVQLPPSAVHLPFLLRVSHLIHASAEELDALVLRAAICVHTRPATAWPPSGGRNALHETAPEAAAARRENPAVSAVPTRANCRSACPALGGAAGSNRPKRCFSTSRLRMSGALLPGGNLGQGATAKLGI